MLFVLLKEKFKDKLDALKEKLLAEEKQRMILQDELVKLKKRLSENNEGIEVNDAKISYSFPDAALTDEEFEGSRVFCFQDKKPYAKQQMRESSSFRSAIGLNRSITGQRATIAKICEEGKILFLISINYGIVGKASRFLL